MQLEQGSGLQRRSFEKILLKDRDVYETRTEAAEIHAERRLIANVKTCGILLADCDLYRTFRGTSGRVSGATVANSSSICRELHNTQPSTGHAMRGGESQPYHNFVPIKPASDAFWFTVFLGHCVDSR